jgi:2-polyprenyl-3-methyl-5-hydroxy-6-metoxy-1,4-benzoquinol methylase
MSRVAEALRLRMIDPARRRRDVLVGRYAPWAAERLYGVADAISFLPFRNEVSDLPANTSIDGKTIDTVDDLRAFTGLPRDTVERILRRRREVSFRSEWLSTASPVREDRWFYLSSRSYLFANAVHFPDASFVDRYIAPNVPADGRVLDFGGGTGELSLRCAARGLHATHVELNALQRDFVRFRVARHDLGDRIVVLDPWDAVPPGAFDAVVAVDVIEHLDDAAGTLAETLLPALAPAGVLVEDSPFVISASNPMHHTDFGLDAFLEEKGLRVVSDGSAATRVWRRGAGAP